MLLVFVALSIALITYDFRQGGSGPLEKAKDISATIVAPIQRGFTTVFRPVADFFSSLAELGDLRSENRELENELRELRRAVQEARSVTDENADLRAELELDEAYPSMDKVTADVIGNNPSNYQWSVFIDKGTEDGVRPDMAVMNADGLVGKVIAARANDATVLLIIDPQGAAKAKVGKDGYTGVVSGNGAGEDLSLNYIDNEAEVEVGDEVSTSAYNEGIFPPNIPVGVVTRVSGDTAAPDQNIDVAPSVDFTGLEIVTVLLESGPRLTNAGGR